MKMPRKVKFDPAWKSFVTIRVMRIGDEDLPAGSSIPEGFTTTRRLRQLYEANRIWPSNMPHPALPEAHDGVYEWKAPEPAKTNWIALPWLQQVALARRLGLVKSAGMPTKQSLHAALEAHVG